MTPGLRKVARGDVGGVCAEHRHQVRVMPEVAPRRLIGPTTARDDGGHRRRPRPKCSPCRARVGRRSGSAACSGMVLGSCAGTDYPKHLAGWLPAARLPEVHGACPLAIAPVTLIRTECIPPVDFCGTGVGDLKRLSGGVGGYIHCVARCGRRARCAQSTKPCKQEPMP